MSDMGKKGMTVLEMLIALSLFAVIMAAAFPLVDQMITRFQMSRDHYVAATVCQARIERARAVPFGDLGQMEESQTLVDDFGNNASPGGRFRRTTGVQVDSPEEGMCTMTVRTEICICTRWGWRKCMHPMRTAKRTCRFTDEHEEMVYLFTEYKQK
jgi:prepilin-type N-terminal cleavage/methylation domain-containing protein